MGTSLRDWCIDAAARAHHAYQYGKEPREGWDGETMAYVKVMRREVTPQVDAVLAEVAAWCDELAARAWEDAKRDAYELVADECRGGVA